MAGEVFIARQDTLETVKGTVDGIDSGVKQTNNALGNFSGGGTDTVKTELEKIENLIKSKGGSGIYVQPRKNGFETMRDTESNTAIKQTMAVLGNYLYELHFDDYKSLRIDLETGMEEKLSLTAPTTTSPSETVVFNNKIYVFCGKNLYAFNGTQWENIGSTPDWVHIAFVYNNILHAVIGASGSTPTLYKLNNKTWQQVRKMPSSSYLQGKAAQFGNYVYFAGTTSSGTTSLIKYNMSTGVTISLSDCKTSDKVALLVCNEKLYIVQDNWSELPYYEIGTNDNVKKYTHENTIGNSSYVTFTAMFPYKQGVIYVAWGIGSNHSPCQIYKIGVSHNFIAPQGSKIYTDSTLYGLTKESGGYYEIPSTQEVSIWAMRENDIQYTVVS